MGRDVPWSRPLEGAATGALHDLDDVPTRKGSGDKAAGRVGHEDQRGRIAIVPGQELKETVSVFARRILTRTWNVFARGIGSWPAGHDWRFRIFDRYGEGAGVGFPRAVHGGTND